MISKMKLHNIGTYSMPIEIYPHKINYFFGGNGTGKTSISKLLNGVEKSDEASSAVEWEDSSREKILVFNRFFIRDNLEKEKDLHGIFTLGEETIKHQKEIDDLKQKIASKEHLIETNTQTEKNLTLDIAEIWSSIEEKCWGMKIKYGKTFQSAFEGYLSSKLKFANQMIKVATEGQASQVSLSMDELQQEYNTAFSAVSDIIPMLSEFNTDYLASLSDTALVEESVIGSTHSQVGELITKLKAGDWVKGGIRFAQQSNGICPYCQQPMADSVQKDIEDYFDESYKKKCTLLEKYKEAYSSFLKYLREYRYAIPDNTETINYSPLQDHIDMLITIAERNAMVVEKKIDNPSQQYTLQSMDEYVLDIQKKIRSINQEITAINKIISDKDAKTNCKSKVWAMCATEIIGEIQQMLKKYNGKKKGLDNVRLQNEQLTARIADWTSDISAIESKISSVKPTVAAINTLLANFGFDGFKLEENTQKSGSYKIVRPDGTDAKDTLSEGEYNFISFLYFYHLCFGSTNKGEINKKKVIVIDDPISSLDSNVLFIVSSLTKDILRKCKDDKANITQVFILTHNAYFHKEVTYWGSREELSEGIVSYYVIRKQDNVSSIDKHKKNPIRSTYESMWDDLKEPRTSVNTLCNTMRRILEHYFNVIGGLNYDKCIDSFEGQDRLICKALISFINDGSHSIFDDYSMVTTNESVDVYTRVFERIFEKMGHIEHYKMMMKDRGTDS